MASKVNTKFVVILSLSLFAGMAAVGGTLYWVKKNDAGRLIRKAEEAQAAGDLKAAERAYAKAVNKRQTDGPLLKKWGEVLQLITPDTQTEYNERYREYVNMRRSYAVMQQTDVGAHKEYLDVVAQETMYSPYNRQGYEFMIETTDRALSFFGKGIDPVNGNPDVLKRYRGMARATIIAQIPDQVDPKVAADAISDLEAAIKADPTDEQSVNSTVIVQTARSITAKKRLMDAEAAEAIEAARKTISSFLTNRPDSPSVQLSALELDIDEATRAATLGKAGAEATVAMKAARAKFQPRLDPIFETMKKVGPTKIEPNTLARIMVAESMIDPESKRQRTEAMLRDIITRQPDNFFALQLLADMLQDRGDVDESIQMLQKIVDLPKRKLSVEGVLLQQVQPTVVGKQARFAMIAWDRDRAKWESAKKLAAEPDKLLKGETLPTEEEIAKLQAKVPAALSKAKDLAAKFRTVAGDNPAVTLLDAQIKYGEGDLSSCQKLLLAYNATTRDGDPDALWLLAQVMMRSNSTGAAEKLIEKVILLQPGNIAALNTLAQIKANFQSYDEGLTLCDRVETIDPGNKDALRIRQGIEAAQGKGAGDTKDPVLQAVAEANKLVMKDQNDKAIEGLRKALPANGYEERIALFLVQQLNFIGDKAGALAVVNETLQKNPKAANGRLKLIKIAMDAKEPLEGELAMIEAVETRPLARHIARANAFRKAGKKEEAAVELKEAAKIDPESVEVLENVFLMELEAKNFPEALKHVEKAEKTDVDRTGGRTFRARYLFAQGQAAEAITLMEVAAKDFALTADTWRVLARMQSTVPGRTNDALASYSKALELRPTDVSLVIENIVLLESANRMDEAMAFARANYKYGQGNADFTRIYLDLEGQYGDKGKTLEERKKMLARDPKNMSNRMAIAWLMLDLKQFDDARKMIDELRKEAPTSLDALRLDARYYADRGDFNTTRNLFAEFLANTPRGETGVEPYLTFAALMFQYEQNDPAFNALEQGRRYQKPDKLEADRMIADRATQLRRAALTEVALRRIVASGTDTDQTMLRRLIENLNSQGNYAEAQTFLAQVTTPPEKDLVLLLLAADTARGLKDDKKAQELLDRAKGSFSNDPRVWVKSAQNNMRRPELASDVEADLNRAIQIDPRNSQLYEIRGGYLIGLGKVEEGITDLQKAVGLNPALSSLRLTLIRELVKRERNSEALALGDDAMKARGNDVKLAIDIGDVFMEGNQAVSAARFYKQAWELNKTPFLAQRYLNCLLNFEPAGLVDAERVLKDRAAEIERSPDLRQARAKLQWRRGRMDDAKRDMRSALDLISADQAGSIMTWYFDLKKIFPKNADLIRQIDVFVRDSTAGPIKDWLVVLKGMSECGESATRLAGIKTLGDIWKQTKSDSVQLGACQQLSIGYYLNNQFEESVNTLKKGLEKFPNDWELNNNIAFTMATNLNRAQEALPYALKTVELRGDNVDSLDTLGTVYLFAGDLDKAEETLKKAAQTPGRLNGQTSALMHLCKTLINKKKFDDAKKVLADLDSIGKSLKSGYPDEQKRDLEALRAAVNSPQNR